jgi:conjugal transfer pilus assembly protein TraV
VKKTLSAIGMMIMSGCALLNPYDSGFSCPETGNGKCVSVQSAYKESATSVSDQATNGTADQKDEECRVQHNSDGICPEGKNSAALKFKSPESRYRSALLDTFSGLLKEPVTPIVAPPNTMRVLILPYTGQDNELNMLRYVYFFVDEPHWLLGDSIIGDEEE